MPEPNWEMDRLNSQPIDDSRRCATPCLAPLPAPSILHIICLPSLPFWMFSPILVLRLLSCCLFPFSDISGEGLFRCTKLGRHLERVCHNHIPDAVCTTVFGAASPEEAHPDRCNSPYLHSEALQCANHCQICCEREEHSCTETSSLVDCAQARAGGKCSESGHREQMVRECPASCGLCLLRRHSHWEADRMCRDAHLDCADMRPLCRVDERVRLMCPLMCGACEVLRRIHEFRLAEPKEEEDCADTGEECRKNVALCEMPVYFDRMARECARSCAHCKPLRHKCEDRDVQKCALWNGHAHRPFCASDVFTKGVKFFHCAHTCNLCG